MSGLNRAASLGLLLLAAVVTCAACAPSHPRTSSAGPPYMPKGDLPVRVTDPEGRPIPGAAVSGSVDVNFGPLPSTCCTPVTLGDARTDANGMATLRRPAFTFHPARIHVSHPGWSPRTLRFSGGAPPVDANGWIAIGLGREGQ